MIPVNTDKIILKIDSSISEELSRSMIVNLQNNLNSTGTLRATNMVNDHISGSSAIENKGDGMLLYALALAFIQSGAAKSLIDAISALFSSSKDKNLKLTLRINSKDIPITATNVKGEQSEMLLKQIEAEISKL
jgi:hypothetical protein